MSDDLGGGLLKPFRSNDDPPVSSFTLFMSVFLAVIAAWSVVALFQRFIDNFTFRTLGMDPNSTTDTGIIFLCGVFGFFIFVWLLEKLGLISTSPRSGNDNRPADIPSLKAEDFLGTGLDDGRAPNITTCINRGTC